MNGKEIIEMRKLIAENAALKNAVEEARETIEPLAYKYKQDIDARDLFRLGDWLSKYGKESQ